MTGSRLSRGGRIDRTRPLGFTFEGRRYTGYAGDTLASALIANDVLLVGRSFKLHRPRGIMSAGAEEPNALVQLEGGAFAQPNQRVTQVELYDGLVARSVNAWPSLRRDVAALSGWLSPMMAAGFYYKTFMWPRAFWRRIYEPAIRHMAGLGVAPVAPDPDTYDKIHVHADVLVIGGGPAGLAAALAAARAGARVILADEQTELGGSLLFTRHAIDDRPAIEWASTAAGTLASCPEVTILTRTTAFGYYDQNYMTLLERRTDHLPPGSRPGSPRQRLWHVRAKQVVLATGAHERPLVFPDNDRPGVMLASAVSTYVRRYGVAPGRRAVIFTNNDTAYRTALDLAEAGLDLAAIIDIRPDPQSDAVRAARMRGIRLLFGSKVARTFGRARVRRIEVCALEGGSNTTQQLDCDLLVVSGGWSPAVHLFSQSQGRLRWDDANQCFAPAVCAPSQVSVGAANVTFSLNGCLAAGNTAGAEAAAGAGFVMRNVAPDPRSEDIAEAPPQAYSLRQVIGRADARAFVDFQYDVTARDIRLAASEGFVSVEHVKRYTTTGMATDQGKTSNTNALLLLAETLGRSPAEVGATTFRPPYSPVTYGALAGREIGALSDPIRTTAMHAWQVESGAVFENVGQWKRPLYCPRDGEDMRTAVRREAKAARTSVAIQDISTLGKIELRGADTAEFLDRVYTNVFSKLPIGRCRYGIMCRDDGMVFDDGVTTRLTDDHYFMTTTTTGAAHVYQWLEELLQTDWPHLAVYATSVTDQWAALALVGPRARDVLRALAPDIPLENAAFPLLSMRSGKVAGFNARVFRISFSGELAYEIYVPRHHGLAAWTAALEAGRPHGITPFGTEAMHVLRAEKGYFIAGQETDGTVTPYDLGLDRMVSTQKTFIGARSLARADSRRPDRKQLVGLLPEDPSLVLPEGAQLIDMERTSGTVTQPDTRSIGHVTSSYWSPNLGRSFALALVKAGRARIGTTVIAPLETGKARTAVVAPVFWDKDGSRQNG